jgi:hypothetical protein
VSFPAIWKRRRKRAGLAQKLAMEGTGGIGWGAVVEKNFKNMHMD